MSEQPLVERLHAFFVQVFTTHDLFDKDKRQEMKLLSFELDDEVAQLKKEIALKADYITRLEAEEAGRDLMDAEANEFLSGMEIVPEGTLTENTILAAKLLAIECGDCGKTMLTCGCDDVENG